MFTQSFKTNFMKHSYFKNYLRLFAVVVVLFMGFSQVTAQSCTIVKDPNDGRACLNDPATFTINVSGGCVITKYDWDFGDGSSQTTTTNTTQHIFTAVKTAGDTITCVVTCSNGSTFTCKLTGADAIKVFPPPVVIFKTTSFNPQCESGNLFNIVDSSYSPSGAKIVFRKILWGDGTSDQSTGNPAPPLNTKTHSFVTYIPGDPDNGKPRYYTVVVEVRDEFGCISRVTRPNYLIVGGRIDVSFRTAYTVQCDSTPVTFTNTSTNILGAYSARPGLLKSFVWNYGDGSPSYQGYSVNDPRWLTHSYQYKNKMGPFDITLTVTDSIGCVNTYLLKRGADNIFTKADFQVTHTGIYSDSDSMCFVSQKIKAFNFKVPQPVHPIFVFKSSYNFGDPNSGPANTYPNKATDPIVWNRDHEFSDCGVYLAKVFVTVYMPDGKTVICSKMDSAYVKVWGPHANIQSPAKGICVLNRYQCHIKDTVYFTNISTYCQGDSALKKADGVTDSIISPNTTSHPTVLRLWDFDDMGNSPICTTYSDPVNPKYFDTVTKVNKFAYRIADTMNTTLNCNYSMDSLPKHWYTPGKEKCYTVKLNLLDLKTGCGDTALLSLALQPPKAKLTGKNSIDLTFQGQKCLSGGNDGRKVQLKWTTSEPVCANQFVWLNFDSACGMNNFTPQTAFSIPPWGGPPVFAYGCSYLGSPMAAEKPVHFSQEGHSFPKDYTKQYTFTCDPTGKVTIGLVVQNGCDSALVSFQDSLWIYWTGCDWEKCPFNSPTQKAACKLANPNTPVNPAYAAIDGAKKINFFSKHQKDSALLIMPNANVVCYACRDTFWYHNAIEYKQLTSTQNANVAVKPKYCVNEEETYCPSSAPSVPQSASQQDLLAATWDAYVYYPGKPNFRAVASDTSYRYTDTIYRSPVYYRLNWCIKQYISNGNYVSDTIGPIDVTSLYKRTLVIDSTFCYKYINGVYTLVITSRDTFQRDSVHCQKFKFTSNGKWVVNLNVTNTDTCDKATEGIRLVIVGNKIDFQVNDTTFCLGEAVKPIVNIRYFWNLPSPPFLPYDPYDYWNDRVRNNAGLSSKEVYFIKWGDGGNYIRFDTAIRSIREHTYNAVGNYTIRIMWKDSDGCFDTLILKDLIHITKPHAAFYLPQKTIACDQIVQFLDSSWIEQDTSLKVKYDRVIGYNWSFGDGSLASAQKNPVHSYDVNGDYFIKLRIFTEQGCEDSIIRKIHIEGPAPEFELAAGTRDTGCLPYEVLLHIKNFSDSTYRTVQIRWGDGRDTILTKSLKKDPFALVPLNTVKHIYTAPGHYCIIADATDTVINDLGQTNPCTRSTCDTCLCVTILDFALADFNTPDTVCVDDVITFQVTRDTLIYTEYNVDFGDGTAIEQFFKPVYTVNHTYTAPGNYAITFTPKDYLCASTKSKNIFVQKTNANFDVADSTNKPTFVFKNTSTGTTSKTKYTWDFGDGKTSNEENPTHTYALLDTGCHNVKLSIDLPCKDDTVKIVCNSYFFSVLIPNVFTVNSDGMNDVFDIAIEGEAYYNLSIYNRWGEKLFHSDSDNDPNNVNDGNNWNGKVNNTGAESPAGEYYFTFEYKTKADPKKVFTNKGIVTLIRK